MKRNPKTHPILGDVLRKGKKTRRVTCGGLNEVVEVDGVWQWIDTWRSWAKNARICHIV